MRRKTKFDKHTQGRIRILQNAGLDEREALQRTVDAVTLRYNKALLSAQGMAYRQHVAFESQAELHGGIVGDLKSHLWLMPPAGLEGASYGQRGRGQGAAPTHASRASEAPAEETEATSSEHIIVATESSPVVLDDSADDSYRSPTTERKRKGLTGTEIRAIRDAITEPGATAMSSEFLSSTPLANLVGDLGDKFVALGFQAGRAPYFGGFGPGNGDQLGFYIGNQFTDGRTTITGVSEEDKESLKFILRKIVGPGCGRIDGVADLLLPGNVTQAIKDIEADPKCNWVLPMSLYGTADEGSGYAAGVYIGCYVKAVGTGSAQTFETMWVCGFWGVIGMSAQEIDIASMKQFDVSTDSVLSAIGYSCLRNMVNHQNPTIELRELSIRTGIHDASHEDTLVKTPTGNFIVVSSVDRRSEFPSFAESGVLPDDLKDVRQPLRSNMRGRIVFVDWANKMIHYYTESGKLHVRLFGTGTTTSNYDYHQFYKQKIPLTHGDIDSSLNWLASLRRRNYPVPTEARSAYMAHPWDRTKDGFSEALAGNTGSSPELKLSLECLKKSYAGDQVLFNLVQSYYDVTSFDMANAMVHGYSFTGSDDLTSMEDVEDHRSSEQRMRIPLIGVLLHLVKSTQTPDLATVDREIAEAKDRMENPELNFVIRGLGKYLNEHGMAEVYKLKPHQVRVLGMLLPLDKGIIDVDMGGGKSIISILKIISMIERLREQGIKPRPLVVVPNALIPTFYREIKKFTKADPADPNAPSALNVVTLQNNATLKRMNRDAMISALQHAPENTIILASYSWLAGDKTPIHTGEYITSGRGKKEPKVEYRFNRVEDLLDLVGVNIVFLDECHKIKANGRMNGDFVHKAAMALSRAPHRFEMTGTFISRTPFDIFNQVKFIDPTILGSLQQFKEEFTDNDGRTWDSEKLKRLRAYLIERGIITVRREEWLYLMPEKREHFHFVDFQREAPIVYKLYRALWKSTLEEFPQELNQLLEGGTLLGGTDSDTDVEMDASIQNLADAETEEQETAALSALEIAQRETAAQIKAVRNTKVAGRMMALRALITAPEKFPLFTAIADQMRSVVDFNVDDLKHGPKDRTVLSIIEQHFAATGGTYVKPSEQTGPEDRKVGKIIIFSDRAIIARHFERILKERFGNGVCYYDSSNRQHLDDFSDPNKEEPFILCAVENSIKEGVNLQSASRIIRLTVPWTTGDYDQSCARAFRTGQKKIVDIDNVVCEMSFEVAMLARLITRENTNKKVSSNYNNAHDIAEVTVNLRTADPDSPTAIKSKMDLERFGGSEGSNQVNLLEIHHSIYAYEKQESYLWKVAYLTKVTDDEDLAQREPSKYITRNTNRAGMVFSRIGHRVSENEETLPATVPTQVNRHLIGVPLRVIERAGRLRGILYVVEPGNETRLKLVSVPLYQLDESNERLEGGQIADTSATYEPWPTTGIKPSEMAQTETLVVDDDSTDNLLHPEEKMEKRIQSAIDEAIDLNIDPRFTKSIRESQNADKIKENLVKIVKRAALNGEGNALFYKSKAMGHLFHAATGLDLDQRRPSPVIDSQIKQASKFVRHKMEIDHAEYALRAPDAPVRRASVPRTTITPDSIDSADRESLRMALGICHQDAQGSELAILSVDMGTTNPLSKDFWSVAKSGKFGRWSLMNRVLYRQVRSTQDFANLQESMEDRGMKLMFDDASKSRNLLQQLLATLPSEADEHEDDLVGVVQNHAFASVDDDDSVDDLITEVSDWAYMAIDRKVIFYIMDTPATAPLTRSLLSLGFKRAARMMMHFTSKSDLPRVVRKIEENGFVLRHRDALNIRAMRILKTRLEDKPAQQPSQDTTNVEQ
jgi:SNF2 family DNA or RNA helicase